MGRALRTPGGWRAEVDVAVPLPAPLSPAPVRHSRHQVPLPGARIWICMSQKGRGVGPWSPAACAPVQDFTGVFTAKNGAIRVNGALGSPLWRLWAPKVGGGGACAVWLGGATCTARAQAFVVAWRLILPAVCFAGYNFRTAAVFNLVAEVRPRAAVLRACDRASARIRAPCGDLFQTWMQSRQLVASLTPI